MSKIPVLVAALLLPAAAQAADIGYTYVDAAYSSQQKSAGEKVFGGLYFGSLDHGTGYQFSGSYGFGNGWFLEGAYRRARYDFSSPTGDDTRLFPKSTRVGGGYHFALVEGLDLVLHADYVGASTRLDSSMSPHYPHRPFSSSATNHGHLVGVGLRFQPTGPLEFGGFVDQDNTGFVQTNDVICAGMASVCKDGSLWRQNGSETVASLTARYHFTADFSLGLGAAYSTLQDWHEWSVSARWNF